MTLVAYHQVFSLFKKSLFFLIFLQFLMIPRLVYADTGPKPRMEFEFKQGFAGDSVTIVSGTLYECQQSDCSDAAPLQRLGPQGFYCQADSCSATAYGFSPYHKIEIVFSDGKTRRSNVFETAGFNSNYMVTVRPEDLQVDAKLSLGVFPPNMNLLLLCICFLCGGVLLLGLIIFFVRRFSRK